MGGKFPLESSWDNSVGEKGKRREIKRKEKKEKEKKKMRSEKLHILSRIHRDRAVVFHRSKRQSSTTRRELRVSTRIRGFLQTLRGMGFSPTLVIFCVRAI